MLKAAYNNVLLQNAMMTMSYLQSINFSTIYHPGFYNLQAPGGLKAARREATRLVTALIPGLMKQVGSHRLLTCLHALLFRSSIHNAQKKYACNSGQLCEGLGGLWGAAMLSTIVQPWDSMETAYLEIGMPV
jgi:hypothetical protein